MLTQNGIVSDPSNPFRSVSNSLICLKSPIEHHIEIEGEETCSICIPNGHTLDEYFKDYALLTNMTSIEEKERIDQIQCYRISSASFNIQKVYRVSETNSEVFKVESKIELNEKSNLVIFQENLEKFIAQDRLDGMILKSNSFNLKPILQQVQDGVSSLLLLHVEIADENYLDLCSFVENFCDSLKYLSIKFLTSSDHVLNEIQTVLKKTDLRMLQFSRRELGRDDWKEFEM
jgi:hypothetical protein